MILGSKIKAGAARENPNLTSGSMTAKKEIKCIDLDVTSCIDHKTAIK